jgi:hypothetical protein
MKGLCFTFKPSALIYAIMHPELVILCAWIYLPRDFMPTQKPARMTQDNAEHAILENA